MASETTSNETRGGPESPVTSLEHQLGTSWKSLQAAREKSQLTRAQLVRKVETERIASFDHCVVVNGSLARDEFTEGSDIDWTFLVDGPADPEDFNVVARIRSIVSEVQGKEVGQEGTFGKMTFSHDLVHQIGGEDDTNSNTTRRILLLLESTALGDPIVHDRVVNCVLKRYLLEDQVFAERTGAYHVPRFLLNDFARYWRTMAVDFAYKSRDRQGKGRALRNIKLRMSRKLIFVSGLLSCFACHLGVVGGGTCTNQEKKACVGCLRNMMRHTPLEIFAKTILHLANDGPKAGQDQLLSEAQKTLEAYDEFLGILADREKREHLERLPSNEMSTDTVFSDARKISHRFRDAITSIFFDEPSGLGNLTRIYGVF